MQRYSGRGSGTNTRIGKPPRVLYIHLGPESEHTVHEAELVGTLLAIQLMKTEKVKPTITRQHSKRLART